MLRYMWLSATHLVKYVKQSIMSYINASQSLNMAAAAANDRWNQRYLYKKCQSCAHHPQFPIISYKTETTISRES